LNDRFALIPAFPAELPVLESGRSAWIEFQDNYTARDTGACQRLAWRRSLGRIILNKIFEGRK
jgi:hypothetical protein